MKTLLTGKQSWRRQSIHDEHFPHVEASYADSAPNNTILGQLWTMTRGGTSTPTHKEPKIEVAERRRVRFQTSVRVILIPSRPEYIAAGLLPVLWWEKSDFPLFKTAAVSEVISLMQARNIKNCKEAMKMLYQSDTSSADESNCESDSEGFDSESAKSSFETLDELTKKAPDSPRSCLKPKNNDEKSVKRPISCITKEDRFNHIQRHLHPLAYMCD